MVSYPYPIHTSIPTLSLVLVGLSLIANIVGTIWLGRLSVQPQNDKKYSYVGSDYPQEWPVGRPPVLMAFDNSLHFRLDSPEGAAEWSAIVPGDGVINLGPYHQPYTISMLHQLRCLDIIRDVIVRDRTNGSGSMTLGRHCLNYVKQMVLCRGDVMLEPFQYPSSRDPIDLNGIHECRDWGAIYEEVGRNQEAHRRWQAAQAPHVI